MQFISNVHEVKLKLGGFILLGIFLLMPELSLGEMSHKSGVYFEAIGGYSKNLAKNTSKFSIADASFRYKANKNLNGPNIHVGTGYQWKINNNWSWNTGWRLGYNKFVVKGKGGTVDLDPSKYKYKISAHNIALINRLIYTQERWKYYAALSLGLGHLKSYKYSNVDDTNNKIDDYKNKTIKEPLYNISLGVMRNLYKNVNLGIDVGCSDLNTAKLGQRINKGGNTVGTTNLIKQKLRMINIDVSFIYQF